MLRLKKYVQRRMAMAALLLFAVLAFLARHGQQIALKPERWAPDEKYPAISVNYKYNGTFTRLSYRWMPRDVRAVPVVYATSITMTRARRELKADPSAKMITVTTGPFHRKDRLKTPVGRNRWPGFETFYMGHGDRGWLVTPKPGVAGELFLSNDWNAITAERDKYYATEMGVVLLPEIATGGFPREWLNRRTARYAIGYNKDSFFVVQSKKSSVWVLRDFMDRVLACTHAALPDGGSAMSGNTRYVIAYCEP